MLKALGSGLVGAVALNVVHETARQIIPHAPRVEVIGKRAIARPMRAMGLEPPKGDRLYWSAMTGDVISNSLYYSLVALGPNHKAVERGLLLGIAAGLGAAFLPPFMGLGNQPGRKAPWTQLLTVAWYTLGGLAAGGALKLLSEGREDRR